MSTKEQGDKFRDFVDMLLSSAGYETATEALLSFKKSDIRAVVATDPFEGPRIFGIETKNYSRTLPKEECGHFVNEYGSLVRNGKISGAWLVSKSEVSSHARELIESNPGLKVFTINEFMRRLLLLERYMSDIISEYDGSNIDSYYLNSLSADGNDLECAVYSWLEEDNPPPLAILGGYGQGKSTLALRIAAKMSEAALQDREKRVPILVRLGEIVDEQSIDGLIGKVLASKYKVGNYHYDTFYKLNESGLFLVIFDGFDEMKHGMTFQRFQQEVNELLKLDQGNARIMMLGRDTALHNDTEFRAIIGGKSYTSLGQEIPTKDRRALRHISISGFDVDRAHQFIDKYFPFKALEYAKKNSEQVDEVWLQNRLSDLKSGKYDDLITRPVHAQMLCDISSYSGSMFESSSIFELYDHFVHYLLDREVSKRGRDPRFNIGTRRRFNSAVAWWLWENAKASTTSVDDIPIQMVTDAAKDIVHEFDDHGLKRELMQGCLVEKASNTIYFGHRSIQEFLVAEHILQTNFLAKGKSPHPQRVMNVMNAEVASFIVQACKVHSKFRDLIPGWFSALEEIDVGVAHLEGVNLFRSLKNEFGDLVSVSASNSPVELWISLFDVDGDCSFAPSQKRTSWLYKVFRSAEDWTPRMQEHLLGLLAQYTSQDLSVESDFICEMLAIWLPWHQLAKSVALAQDGKSVEKVKKNEQTLLWSFLSLVEVGRDEREGLHFMFSPAFIDDMLQNAVTPIGGDCGILMETFKCEAEKVYKAAEKHGVSRRDIGLVANYFNSERLKHRISPLEVVSVRRRLRAKI